MIVGVLGALLMTSPSSRRTPVFVAMGGAAMLLFWRDATPIASVPAETFRLVQSPTLPAIPLLTIAGYVLAEGGAPKRLVRAYKGFFGWLPGGVAVMATVVCALLHHLHRRLGRHHPRAGRAAAADADGGEVPRGLLATAW